VEQEVPGVAVSTDIIVGFPGETEELFQESMDFAARMNFSRMHVFPYSPRQGTPAAQMPDHVPESVKKERAHLMQALAAQKATEFRKGFLGRTMEVLCETQDAQGITDGLTGNYLRIYTDAPVESGEIYPMRLEKIYRDGLWGIPVENRWKIKES
jgi:threonylcarbamoyladenosine tRNA methylthiotransferase MtaB